MKIDQVIDLILNELKIAEKKHPGWPEDKIHCAAILGEELGELIQASIDYEYAKNDENKNLAFGSMIQEAAQCGAMAIRFLLNIK